MNTELLAQNLNAILTDKRVITDVYEFLSAGEDGDSTSIELDEGWVPIPINVPLFIINKSFVSRNYDIGFGTYRALVSLGTPIKSKSGNLEAQYCFSTLYYNSEVKMITLDFHTRLRY